RFEFGEVERLRESALAQHLNFRYRADGGINIALDETTEVQDIHAIVRALATAQGATGHPVDSSLPELESEFPPDLARTSAFLTHPVFNTHHSETEMMRYLRRLERKAIGLDTSMIPLGSCTMKLNAATEMLPLTWPEFSKLHPFAPEEQSHGYQTIFGELEAALCRITGFAAVSLQPNSGAQGEFAGLMAIRAYHRARGGVGRTVVLIPSSAHGTNPASAAMAGLKVVVVACDADGNIDLNDLRAKAVEHRQRL